MSRPMLSLTRRRLVALAGGAALVATSGGAWLSSARAQLAPATPGVAPPAGVVPPAGVAPAGDAFEILTQDHREVEALFQRIQATPGNAVAERTALLEQLKLALTGHALAEENIVYPALRQYIELQDMSLQLAAEHGEIKNFLFMLEQEPKDTPRWIQTAAGFEMFVMEHVQEEEQQVFPSYRTRLDPIQLQELTTLVMREKALLAV
jgi:hemerythrin superfamily protein